MKLADGEDLNMQLRLSSFAKKYNSVWDNKKTINENDFIVKASQ